MEEKEKVQLSFSFVPCLLPSLKHGFESTFYGAINSPRRVAFLAPSRQGKEFANGKVSGIP